MVVHYACETGREGTCDRVERLLKTGHVFGDNWLDDDGPSYDRRLGFIDPTQPLLVMYL